MGTTSLLLLCLTSGLIGSICRYHPTIWWEGRCGFNIFQLYFTYCSLHFHLEIPRPYGVEGKRERERGHGVLYSRTFPFTPTWQHVCTSLLSCTRLTCMWTPIFTPHYRDILSSSTHTYLQFLEVGVKTLPSNKPCHSLYSTSQYHKYFTNTHTTKSTSLELIAAELSLAQFI